MIPVMYLIGMGLKKSSFKDCWIPLALGVISIMMSAMWIIATSNVSALADVALLIFTAVTQGVLVAGAAVYMNQLYVQAKKDE